jgi:hypothetical protein
MQKKIKIKKRNKDKVPQLRTAKLEGSWQAAL